jgi:hypothetical protein
MIRAALRQANNNKNNHNAITMQLLVDCLAELIKESFER